MSLRTPKMEAKYAAAKTAGELIPLSQEDKIKGSPDFFYWKVVNNRFPHDRHHSAHSLVVLRRDCSVDDLTTSETLEFWEKVVPWADEHYDFVKFNLSSMRSVQATPHFHLCNLKREFK